MAMSGAHLTVDELGLRLGARRPRRIRFGRVVVQSAVTVILRDSRRNGVEVLLARRAERDGDPWSGHMAFPGGRRHPDDRDLRATAERELGEETGLAIATAGERLPAGLGDLVTRAHEKPVPMLVRPFVYRLVRPRPRFRLSHEIRELVWVPLAFFADDANRVPLAWHFAGTDWQLPSYVFGGRRIWGLTLMILGELVSVSHGVRFARLPGLEALDRLWRRRHLRAG